MQIPAVNSVPYVAPPGSRAASCDTAPQEPPAVQNFMSPTVRFDQSAQVVVFSVRDTQTGAIQFQYPSQKAVDEYRKQIQLAAYQASTEKMGTAQASSASGQVATRLGAGQPKTGDAAPLPGSGSTSGSAAASTYGSGAAAPVPGMPAPAPMPATAMPVAALPVAAPVAAVSVASAPAGGTVPRGGSVFA